MCIVMCMRTNIVLNDELIAKAMKLSQFKSKRGVVEEALTAYVTMKNEERQRLAYCEELQRLRKKTRRVRLHSDSREIIRQDRAAR